MDAMTMWNIILTSVAAPAFWAFRQMFQEIKRIQILLNQTREQYARRDDVRNDLNQLMAHLNRIEDKLDKVLTK